MPWNSDVSKPCLSYLVQKGAGLRRHDHVMTEVSNALGELQSIELRSSQFHGMRIDQHLHAGRSLQGAAQASGPAAVTSTVIKCWNNI